jgi:hypothetical protein
MITTNEKQHNLNLFNTVFEQNYKLILKNAHYKYKIDTSDLKDIMHNVYISCSNAILNKGGQDFSTDKKILNYIYYSVSSAIKKHFKNYEETIESNDNLFYDTIVDYKDDLIETGKDLFYDKFFEYLNRLVSKNLIKQE